MLRRTLIPLLGGLCAAPGIAQTLELPIFGSGAFQTSPNTSAGVLVGSLTYHVDTGSIDYDCTIADLEGNPSHAHVHSAPLGADGPILFHMGFPIEGAFAGTMGPANPTQVTALLLEQWYVNMHTSEYPNGEVRAQVRVPRFLEAKNLSGANAVPPNASAGHGRARFEYEAETRTVSYNVRVEGTIAPPRGANLVDETGAVVARLDEVGTGQFDGETDALDDDELLALLTGGLDLVVTTDFDPDGELRSAVTVGLLNSDTPALGASNGGTQRMSIDAGNAYATRFALIVASASGTGPGLPLPGGEVLPLVVDFWTSFALANPSSGPYFGLLGVLDGQGRGSASFTLPSNSGVGGLTLHHAVVVLDASASYAERVGAALPLEILP